MRYGERTEQDWPRLLVLPFFDQSMSVYQEQARIIEEMAQKSGLYYCGALRRLKRAKYYEFYTGHKWGDKLNSDLCINTSRTVIKELVPAVARLFEKDEKSAFTVQHK